MTNLVRHTPQILIEIQGVDITHKWEYEHNLVINRGLDFPNLSVFRSSDVSLVLDNTDGEFHTNQTPNFFTRNSLPVHGRGGKVLIKIGLSSANLTPVFAGQIIQVRTSLQSPRAVLDVRDLSVQPSINTVANFGEVLTRHITDFEGATDDYTEINPIFKFPSWGIPISEGSLTLTIRENNVDVPLNIVDTVEITGILNNRNVELDYQNGLIKFEAPPTSGADSIITATWKRDFYYRRPDALIRLLLKESGLQNLIGITDDTQAAFGINQALLTNSANKNFSSHGKPNFQNLGTVRWMKRQEGSSPAIYGAR